MKTTCRKPWPVNLFQVLNLTPASRLNGVVTRKRPYFSLNIGAMGQNIKKDHQIKSPGLQMFLPEKNCSLILKNKNGPHSQLFKNH